MQCPKCQFENRESAKFCNECGHNFDVTCSECNASNKVGSKFCDECGLNLLKQAAPPLPANYSEPGSYTPQFLAEKILTSRSSIEGERKIVTVLFADVANYTAMSEKLDPEEIHQIMDGCFKILMDEIHKYEGTINQFTGDGVMALFGAPLAHEDHAQRACHAALTFQKSMEEYGNKINNDYGVEFKLRVGINSGPVIVGAIGDNLRMDYTAVGDTTNLSARLEAAAQPGTIQISDNTYRLVKLYFDFENSGFVSVKGKQEPQQSYKLIKSSEVQTRFDASISRGLVKFVGRNNSMAALKNALEKVTSGSGQVLGVVGEAGVGKSRLLLEFRDSLASRDFTYLEGRCLHYGASMAYLPFLDILKSYFKIDERNWDSNVNEIIKNKLATLDEKLLLSALPAFQDLLSIKVENEDWQKLKPKRRKEQTFEALRNLLIRLSKVQPLIIAVEDLHWIDRASEEFLSYFIDSAAQAPILLILLYRPEYTHQWGSKSYYSKIGLDQLTMETSTELVSTILESSDVAPELIQLLLSRSTGNPFFIEEFTQSLLENGSIEKRNDQFVLNRAVGNIQVPDTIQGIIAARIDRLEDNLKETMQVASVIGRDFVFRILKTITGMQEELKSFLINLQGLEFIYEKNLIPELEYIFKHALTQEVAYNSLLLNKRKKIHERIGKAIEDIYAYRLEEFYELLAYHYSRSDNLEKAYHYLILSGKKAAKTFLNWETLRHYKRAITILKKQPHTEKNKRDRLNVILSMFTSIHQLGFPEDSIQFVHEGERLSIELGIEDQLANFYSMLGVYYTYKGDQSQGIKYTEKSFQAAQKIKDVGIMSSSAQALCNSYFIAGNFQRVVNVAPISIDLLEKMKKEAAFFPGGFNSYSTICGYCGVSYAFLGNFVEAEALCEKGHRLAVKINHIPSLAWIEALYGYLYNIKGDGKNAGKYFERSVKHLEEGQVSFMLGMAWSGLGWAYWYMGEFESSLFYAEKGMDIQLKTGNPFYLSFIYLVVGMNHYSLGDINNAKKFVQKALGLSEQIEEKHLEALSRIWLGRVLAKTNPSQIDKAIQSIFDGIGICGDLKIKPDRSLGHLFLGELYAHDGQQEKALDNLKKAESMFMDMGMDYWLDRTQEVLQRL